MGSSTYLGLGWWTTSPLAPGHPTSICDIGVNVVYDYMYVGKAKLTLSKCY